MGDVKRKANSKMKITVENFEKHYIHFLCNMKSIAMMEAIPSSLILNWGHSGLKYVPVSTWTMAPKGLKKVPLQGSAQEYLSGGLNCYSVCYIRVYLK